MADGDRWGRMPAAIMAADASLGAKVIYTALAMYSSDAGVAWPSVATLAEVTHLSDRQVRRYLREVVALGWATAEPTARTTRYTLRTPDISDRGTPDRYDRGDRSDPGQIASRTPDRSRRYPGQIVSPTPDRSVTQLDQGLDQDQITDQTSVPTPPGPGAQEGLPGVDQDPGRGKRAKGKRSRTPTSAADPEALALADELRAAIVAADPGHRIRRDEVYTAATRRSWAKTLGLMIRRDGVTAEEIRTAIAYLARGQDGTEYPLGIESADSLRRKWDRLRGAMTRRRSPANGARPSHYGHGRATSDDDYSDLTTTGAKP